MTIKNYKKRAKQRDNSPQASESKPRLLYTAAIPIEKKQNMESDPMTDNTNSKIEKSMILVKWLFMPLFYMTLLFKKINEYQLYYRTFSILPIFRVDTNSHTTDLNQTMRDSKTTGTEINIQDANSESSNVKVFHASRRKKQKRKFFDRPCNQPVLDLVPYVKQCKSRTYIKIERDQTDYLFSQRNEVMGKECQTTG